MPELTADAARKMMKTPPTSLERLSKAIQVVEKKIKDKAEAGQRTVMDPFDNLGLTRDDRVEMVNVFRGRGFRFMDYSNPDPGYPCSRDYSELSW